MITGSTAAGEAFLPHIQNVTKAKTPETMRLDVDVAEHVPHVLGKFGCKEERTWPVSWEFFVPAGTDLTAKLLSDILMRESKNASSRRKPHKIAASKL